MRQFFGAQVTPECAYVAAGDFLADKIFFPFFSFVLVSFNFPVTGSPVQVDLPREEYREPGFGFVSVFCR